MVHISRRTALGCFAAALGSSLARGADRKLQIGVTDWNLKLGAKPEAVPLAAHSGGRRWRVGEDIDHARYRFRT